MITVKCDVPGCNREFNCKDQITARRVLGFHKSQKHGIPGKWARKGKPDAEGNYKCKYCSQTFPKLQMLGSHVRLAHKAERDALKRNEARKAYGKAWREKHKNAAPLSPSEQAHRRQLQKTAWWQVESDPQPIKLDRCPCCGARFMAVKSSE